jgi:hypothetical protein
MLPSIPRGHAPVKLRLGLPAGEVRRLHRPTRHDAFVGRRVKVKHAREPAAAADRRMPERLMVRVPEWLTLRVPERLMVRVHVRVRVVEPVLDTEVLHRPCGRDCAHETGD